MATAGTETNSKPPQVQISARSAVGVGSTGNADEELEVSSKENAEKKLEVPTDENEVKDPIGNTAGDKESAEAEDEENCPSATQRTVTSCFSRAWKWWHGSAADKELNCSKCNEPLGLKKSQLNDPDAASTIRCQK